MGLLVRKGALTCSIEICTIYFMRLRIITIFLLAAVSSCALSHDGSNSTRSKEKPQSQPEKPLDPAGKKGPLSWQEQLERLHKLKRQGKELRLIIGRKNDETDHPPLPEIADGEWVFNDVEPSSRLSADDPIQLQVDLSDGLVIFDKTKVYDVTVIRNIESDIFTQIVFDHSVWKFIGDNVKPFVFRAHRLLKPGGKLFFPENFGGATVSLKPLPQGYILKTSPNEPDCVIGIEVDVNRPNDTYKRAYDEIAERYGRFFVKMGFSSVVRHIEKPYVVGHYGKTVVMTNFYEITK